MAKVTQEPDSGRQPWRVILLVVTQTLLEKSWSPWIRLMLTMIILGWMYVVVRYYGA